jgi:hypothetical protein
MFCHLCDPNIHLSVHCNLGQLNPFHILIIYFLNIHVLCAPIYPKCYIGTMRNVLKILIGKRKGKTPLRSPRHRWEIEGKIKGDVLLNIGLYYCVLKREEGRSSETFVPTQQNTWHTNTVNVLRRRHTAVLCYCKATDAGSQTQRFVISKVISVTWSHYMYPPVISPSSGETNTQCVLEGNVKT